MANDSTGPFLRIDERSEMRSNFLEEFTIATREGVDAYYAESGGVRRGSGLGGLLLCVLTLLHVMLSKDKS